MKDVELLIDISEIQDEPEEDVLTDDFLSLL